MPGQMPIPKPDGEPNPFINPVVMQPGELTQGQHYFDEKPYEPKKQVQPDGPTPPDEPPVYDMTPDDGRINGAFVYKQNTWDDKKPDKKVGQSLGVHIVDAVVENHKRTEETYIKDK